MNPDTRANKKISQYGLAIVSGGSSGIGKAIIECILKVQSPPAVCNLSRTGGDTFFVRPEVEHLACDLSAPAARKRVFKQALARAQAASETAPILLVNNAGFGLYDNVDTRPIEEHLELIEVNVAALVELTLEMLPLLKERGGTILNIASTAAFQATPHMATYGASKAFVLNWTLALNEELRPFPHTDAIAICPGPTRTQFFKRAGFNHAIPGGLSMSAEAVAQKALLALASGKSYQIIGAWNSLIAQIASRLPRHFGAKLASRAIGQFRIQNKKEKKSCR